MSQKIIRTICLFRKELLSDEAIVLEKLSKKLINAGFVVQTKRVCSPDIFGVLEKKIQDESIMLSVGTMSYQEASENLELFYSSKDNFNVELSQEDLTVEHTDLLFNIIKHSPKKTFNFTYVFNNAPSSPYMPSASYEQDGFAVGLQPTDLATNADSLEEWFENMRKTYQELIDVFQDDSDFLGIDSSIAPLFEGNSSLAQVIKRFYNAGFNQSFSTDLYTRISHFIKTQNPKMIGLSGIMLPCLEDFELAREYEKGNFTVERNIFVSMHCGLGIDTYPIGIDEKPERVLEILQLVQALSNRYKKPLSVRFVSDGKAKIGQQSNFENEFLYDLKIKAL